MSTTMNPLFLFYNKPECVSMPYGFQKDKSGEKLAETEEDLLEHRTDGTNTFDTLFISMVLYPHVIFRSRVGTGFLGK